MDYLQLEIQIVNDFIDSNGNPNDKIHYII